MTPSRTPRAFSIFTNGSWLSWATLARKMRVVPVQAVRLMAMITLSFPGFRYATKSTVRARLGKAIVILVSAVTTRSTQLP